MYTGTKHVFDNKFNCVSDLMERYYDDGKGRPSSEYRAELRNMARIAYRIAKKAVKEQNKG